jgi:hypothetical protein
MGTPRVSVPDVEQTLRAEVDRAKKQVQLARTTMSASAHRGACAELLKALERLNSFRMTGSIRDDL